MREFKEDERGNITYYKDRYGYEHWKDYDEYGRQIHYKTSNGYECYEWWAEYDEYGRQIHYKNSEGDEEKYEYQYDEYGNLMSYKRYIISGFDED